MDIVVRERTKPTPKKEKKEEYRNGFVAVNIKRETYDGFHAMYESLKGDFHIRKYQLMAIALNYLKENGGSEKVEEILREAQKKRILNGK